MAKRVFTNFANAPKVVCVKPNFAIGDVVLLADTAAPRGKWPLGRIVQIFPDDLGHVRQVMVKSQNKTFRRPISKLGKLL